MVRSYGLIASQIFLAILQACSFESLRKSVKIIQDYDVKSLSILIGVNRGPHTQVEGIPVHQIVTHAEVLELRRRFE